MVRKKEAPGVYIQEKHVLNVVDTKRNIFNTKWFKTKTDILPTEPENFLGKTGITCTYTVTNTANPVKLCNDISGFTNIIVNGVPMERMDTDFTFNEKGKQIVSFVLKDAKTIDRSMFENCHNITSLKINKDITTIKSNAFHNCSGLTEILIFCKIAPEIETNTFEGVAEYGTLKYPEGSNYSEWLRTDKYYLGYYYWNQEQVLLSCTYDVTSTSSPTKLCNYISGFTDIMVGGESIGLDTSYKFNVKGEQLVEYKLKNTVIQQSQFSGCTSLSEIVIPEEITEISNYAFQGCSNLTNIISSAKTEPKVYSSTFKDVPYYGTLTYPTGSDYKTWLSTSNYYLGYYYWNQNQSILTCVYKITNTSSATKLCGNISGFTDILVDGVSIGLNTTYTFNSTGNHTVTFKLKGDTITSNAFASSTTLTKVTIPNTLKSIGENAFSGCTNLSEIISNATTAPSISANTFKELPYYGKLTYPSGSNYSSWLSTNAYYLGYYYWNQSQPTLRCVYNVTSTSSPTKLCDRISGFTDMLFNGVSIGLNTGYTFSITGEYTVEFKIKGGSIVENSFYYCPALKDVKVPDSVTNIDAYAFYSCYGLTSIELGSGLAKIGNDAFSGCSGLTEITCNAITAPTVYQNTFKDVPYYGTLNYPEGSDYSSWLRTDSYYLGYYKWNQTQPIVVCVYNVSSTTSKTKLCGNTSGFTDIVVDGKSIGLNTGYTFSTTGERTVQFKLNTTNIGSDTFTSCTSLIKVTIPNTITTIYNNAFSGCTSLSEITCSATTAPAVYQNTFKDVPYYGKLNYPAGSDYSNWLRTDEYYLGYYAWNQKVITVTCVFDVTDTSLPTKLCGNITGFTEIFVNGKSVGLSTGYTFNIPGNHTVTYNLKTSSIGVYAFSGCTAMTSAIIPSAVTNINNYAFSNCSGLTEITCNATTAPTIGGNNTFYGVPQYGTLNYPDGSDYSQWLSKNSYYLGFYKWNETAPVLLVTCVYDVTSTTTPTKLYNRLSYIGTGFSEIIIDGVSIGTGSTGYTFNTIDKHTVVFKLKNSLLHFGAFENCDSLISVELSDSVTSIDSYAFEKCYNLTTITFGSGFTDIGNYAFSGCTGLAEIVIPDSVTSIGSSAFTYCTGLTSIELGSGLTSIGNQAFTSCYNLESIVVSSGNATYDSRNNSIIETNTNKLILGCKNTIIPNTVTSIGEYAFYYCTGLTSIDIPDSITSIGNQAFNNCSGLTGELVIPDSVTSIGSSAFAYCSGLTSLELGSGLTIIGYNAFSYCYGLRGELVIPDSVTSIGNSAFSGCGKLTSLKLNSGLTIIGDYAFTSCSGLTGELVIPDSVTSIGYRAFYRCYNFNSIVVSAGNTAYDSRNGSNCLIETSGNTVLLGCKNSVIPNTITSIGDSAFRDCRGLTSIDIPDSVTSIESSAFHSCAGLTSASLGSGLTEIGESAFERSELTKLILPSKLERIGDNAFLYNDISETVSIPSTVKEIGVNILGGNYIAGIIVDKNNEVYDSREDCNAIIRTKDNVLICGCSNTKIPSGVEEISTKAFYSCYNLGSIVFPESLKTIQANAFGSCTRLLNVNITKNITSIGTMAFDHCIDLTGITVSYGNTKYDSRNDCNCIIEISTNVLIQGCKTSVIPDSVTKIGSCAFINQQYLTSIKIPDSITSIGSQAFYGCTRLSEIICNATTAPTIGGNNTFYDVKRGGTLSYPSGSDYSSWLNTKAYYLGYYGWEGKKI